MTVIKELEVIYGLVGYRADAPGCGELDCRAALRDGAGGVDLEHSIRRADDDRRFHG